MTLFGCIWFCIIVWDFIKKPINNTVLLTILFMTFQSTNVLYVNGTGIGPGVLTSIVCILKIFLVQKFRIRRLNQPVGVFVASIIMLLIIYFSLVLNGTFGDSVLLFLQIAVYIICFMSIQFIRKVISQDLLYQSIRKIIAFHVIFGVIQILTTTNVLPLRPVLNILFYNDPSTDVVFHRAHYARVMSTFMEPSYYAGFLVGAFFFLMIHKEKIYQNKLLISAIIIEILLTQSSTAYGALLIVGLILILFSNSFTLKQKAIIIILGTVGFLVLYFGFYSLLDAVIFSKDQTGSYSTRVRMNTTALRAFYSSPLIGIGYKNCRGSSIVYSLLGEMGIIGLGIYFIFNIFVYLSGIIGSKYADNILTASKFGVLATMICQIIACPDLDLCTYWVWLYIFSFALRSLKQNVRDSDGYTRQLLLDMP